jgi:hypothetical protein
MQWFLVGAVWFGFMGIGQVGAETRNGAVPGLMPPVMELQVAARLEAKTLRQLAQILEHEAPNVFRTGRRELQGAAEGLMLRQGMSADATSWRFGGVGRETTPILLHVSDLMKALAGDRTVTESQLRGLRDWFEAFQEADRTFMLEPSLQNLRALSDSLESVEVPMRAFDAPETRFLETALNASKLQRRSFEAIDFFASIQSQLKAGVKEKPAGNPVLEGVTMDVDQALKNPNGKVFQGMDAAFKEEIERLAAQLEAFSKTETTMLGGETVWFRNAASRGRTIASQLEDETFATLKAVVEWSNEVYETSFYEPALAPALLIQSQMMLVADELDLLRSIGKGLDAARKQKVKRLTLNRGGIKVMVNGVDQTLTFDFVEVGSLRNQIETTLRLARNTLEQSKLDKVNTSKLMSVIDALEGQRAALGKPTLGTEWVNWVTTLSKLVDLYNF